MATGQKSMQMNTGERALSTDINRLQKFQGAAMAELMRYMLDVTGNDDLDAGGVVTEHTASETPMRAEIINGLMVQPQTGAGVFDLLVTPGAMFAVAPDADPDASVYKYVKDPGIQTLGQLLMGGNAGGSPRIDVIECTVSSVVVETSNRDVFNPTTGTFTASSQTKAVQDTCTFVGGAANIRVRQGTIGGGFPGLAAGWLPLAVASVPAGATANDQMTFWDVRPLISDREFQPFAAASQSPRARKNRFAVFANGALTTASGWFDSITGGRRLGGRMRSGFGTNDLEVIDLSSTVNQEGTGVVQVNHTAWFLYALTPFGLPRWARYHGAAPRQPRSPRGLLVASMVGPDADGNPSAPITLPAGSGLGGTCQVGACIGAGWCNAGVLAGFHGDETGHYLAVGDISISTNPIVVAATAAAVDPIAFVLTPNIHFPANAKSLLVEISYSAAPAADASENPFNQVEVMDPTGVFVLTKTTLGAGAGATFAGQGYTSRVAGWIPIPPVYPSTTPPGSQLFQFRINASVPASVNNGLMRIVGWRI